MVSIALATSCQCFYISTQEPQLSRDSTLTSRVTGCTVHTVLAVHSASYLSATASHQVFRNVINLVFHLHLLLTISHYFDQEHPEVGSTKVKGQEFTLLFEKIRQKKKKNVITYCTSSYLQTHAHTRNSNVNQSSFLIKHWETCFLNVLAVFLFSFCWCIGTFFFYHLHLCSCILVCMIGDQRYKQLLT